MDKRYEKAYTEVLEILKHIPKEEYNLIPKTEIQFYERNCDKNYKFIYDESTDVKNQAISREANAVIVALYMNYFANEKQKSIINEILRQNSARAESEKRAKYNPDKIFDRKSSQNLPIEVNEEKENFFKKIFNKLKSIFDGKTSKNGKKKY